jgi:hypothetical protein
MNNSDILIEKSIILGIIFYIMTNKSNIKNNGVFIEQKGVRKLIQTLFPDIRFLDKKIKKYNIYIRTRTNNGICIDYLNNYNMYIESEKVKVLPWCDILNDPLIMYHVNKKKKIYITEIHDHIQRIYKIYSNKDTEMKIFKFYNKIYPSINGRKILSDHIDIVYNLFERNKKINSLVNYLIVQYSSSFNQIMSVIEVYGDEDKNKILMLMKNIYLDIGKIKVLLYSDTNDKMLFVYFNMLEINNKYITLVSMIKDIENDRVSLSKIVNNKEFDKNDYQKLLDYIDEIKKILDSLTRCMNIQNEHGLSMLDKSYIDQLSNIHIF